MSLGDRIRQARERVGLSQTELARRMRVGQTTISKWERGRGHGGSDPNRRQVEQLARELNCTVRDLELGDKGEDVRKIRLMGYVGAGHAIHLLEADFPLDYIDAPPTAPEGAEAAIVRGDSMFPAYRDGNVVVWWTWSADPSLFIGQPCVCKAEGLGQVLKIVEPGSRSGLWTLVSVNQSTPPIRDVRLSLVAPIEIALRRVNWRG